MLAISLSVITTNLKNRRTGMIPEFKNETYLDFSLPENKKGMQDAIAKLQSEVGKEYDGDTE